MKKSIIYIICSVLLVQLASAQDAHLSQYRSNPMVFNPALTGMTGHNKLRVNANYRSQWGALGSNFVTTAVSADVLLQDRWGVGGYFLNSDFAGEVNSFSFVLGGAYQITTPKNRKQKISAGLNLGFIYKRNNVQNLTFDNQYDQGNFDPDLPSGENLDNASVFSPEVALGVDYEMINRKSKFRPNASVALFHLTTPKEQFLGGEEGELPMRIAANLGCKIEASKYLLLEPTFLFMKQGGSQELNAGVRGGYILPSSYYRVLGGLHYRFDDAIIVELGFKYNSNTYRVSYDINTSPLKEFSNNRGGVEFSVMYNPGGKSGSRRYW